MSAMQKARQRRKAGCAVVCTPTSTSNAASAPQTSGGRCLQPGPVSRNPYLNFLRDYRKNHCGLGVLETVKQGAVEWGKLAREEKLKYIEEAFYAPLRRRRRRRNRSMIIGRSAAGSRRSRSRRAARSAGGPRRSRSRRAAGRSRSARSLGGRSRNISGSRARSSRMRNRRDSMKQED